jgi:hypothetical protein
MPEEKIKTVGNKSEVFRGKAKHTPGGLKKEHLMKNNTGKVVSKNASAAAKKSNNLIKAGYTTEKGKFGSVYNSPTPTPKKSPKKSPKKKGGKGGGRKSPKKSSGPSFF